MSAITVTNVAPSAEESNLREFFSTAGEIERVRIFNVATKSGRKAVIEFTHKEAVSAAVLLNGCLLLNHPLNIAECAYPVSDDVANEGTTLNSFESKFAGFLGKTLLAGKQAMAAVKDFDERNQITAKTKENIKAMDEKLQISSSMKKFDEKAGLSTGDGFAHLSEFPYTSGQKGVVPKCNLSKYGNSNKRIRGNGKISLTKYSHSAMFTEIQNGSTLVFRK